MSRVRLITKNEANKSSYTQSKVEEEKKEVLVALFSDKRYGSGCDKWYVSDN